MVSLRHRLRSRFSTGFFGAVLLVCAACGPSREELPAPSPPSTGPMMSEAEQAPLDCIGEPCRDDRYCPPEARCIDHVCLASSRDCSDDRDCRGDTRCLRGACVAYEACARLEPFRRACRQARFVGDTALPPLALRCQASDWNSTSLPVVADLDGDGRPEVVTQTFPSALLAVHADTCEPLFRRQVRLRSDGMGSLAVADLDADGHPEIVTVDAEHRLVVFSHRGEPLATAPEPSGERNPYGGSLWSAPALADLDGVAPPEIILGAQVGRYLGPAAGGPRLDLLWSRESQTPPWGSLAIAVDLDEDGRKEVVSSERIHDGLTGADKTPPALRALLPVPFFPQVADFNGDGHPDLLIVESRAGGQVVRVFDYARQQTIFGPYRAGDGGFGGPAVIADFDGDGTPDFGLGGERWFYAYALRCAPERSPDGRPAGCLGHEPGLLWSRRIDDRSSGSAGVAAFDLNGDGAAEILYRDECWLRILSGLSGRTLTAYNATSSTGIETPTVADIDGDGHAEILVVGDVDVDLFGFCARAERPEADRLSPWLGFSRGLFVLSDPERRFMPTRALWNQHSYHAGNIGDDLIVPSREPPFWQSHNSFRTAQPAFDPRTPPPAALPDLTGRLQPQRFPSDCSAPWTVAAQVCNRGAAPAAAPIFASFYAAAPDGGSPPVCTARLDRGLSPGECAPLSCLWSPPPTGRASLHLRVADAGRPPRTELVQCRDDNDDDALLDLLCYNPPS